MDIYEIRKRNLVSLIGSRRKGACAEKWEMAPAHLSQILSDRTEKNLGDDVARRIEAREGLPHGWFDKSHDYEVASAEHFQAREPQNSYPLRAGMLLLTPEENAFREMNALRAQWPELDDADKDYVARSMIGFGDVSKKIVDLYFEVEEACRLGLLSEAELDAIITLVRGRASRGLQDAKR